MFRNYVMYAQKSKTKNVMRKLPNLINFNNLIGISLKKNISKEMSVITTCSIQRLFSSTLTHRSSFFRAAQNFCYVSPANFASSNCARNSLASSGIWVLAVFSCQTSSASSSPSSWKSRGISSASVLPAPRS